MTARPSVREQRGCDGSERRSWLWEALGDPLEGLGAHQRSRPLFVLKSPLKADPDVDTKTQSGRATLLVRDMGLESL